MKINGDGSDDFKTSFRRALVSWNEVELSTRWPFELFYARTLRSRGIKPPKRISFAEERAKRCEQTTSPRGTAIFKGT